MNDQYLILAGLWIMYFVLHSVFAATSIKNYFYTHLRFTIRSYRIVYTSLASFGLIAILLYASVMKDEYVFTAGKGIKYSGLFLSFWGIIILKASFKQYNLKEFLGLAEGTTGGMLHMRGILRKIRHPLYSATILLVVGFTLFIPKTSSFVTLACVLLYLVIGIYLEEKKLIDEFGETYLRYKNEVPMLVPRFWKKK